MKNFASLLLLVASLAHADETLFPTLPALPDPETQLDRRVPIIVVGYHFEVRCIDQQLIRILVVPLEGYEIPVGKGYNSKGELVTCDNV